MEIGELVNGLFNKDDKAAYKCLKELLSASEQDNGVYQFFNTITARQCIKALPNIAKHSVKPRTLERSTWGFTVD